MPKEMLQSSEEEKIKVILLAREDAESVASILSRHGIDVLVVPYSERSLSGIMAIAVAEEDVERVTALFHRFGVTRPRAEVSSESNEILIPVDLTEKSFCACRMGFDLADRLGVRAEILHTYLVPTIELNIVEALSQDDQLMSAENARNISRTQLDNFLRILDVKLKEGVLTDAPHSASLMAGIPEECIREKAKNDSPRIIVMATRNRHKKAEELIGSVTAEVLDSCRVPLFTVPEDYAGPGIRQISRLLFFCHGDRHDLDSMEQFLSLFNYPHAKVTLLPGIERGSKKAMEYVASLANTLRKTYPNVDFDTLVLSRDTFRDDFKQYVEQAGIELLIVQNKKKNIFSRLINPGIAHILLYERDMPMIILPI